MVKIFDTHSHYDDSSFDDDRDELLKSMKDNGVYRIVTIGACIRTSQNACRLAQSYEDIYASIGVHPTEIDKVNHETYLDELRQLYDVNREKIVAVGEIGLDYHYPETDKELEKEFFVEQMNYAREINLPIIIHSRDAAMDTLDIMKAEKAHELGGVVHCYSYSKEVAKTFLDMDFYFGIGGVVTFSNARKLKETVEYVPLDKIVLETDCPYLAPAPFRGKRNDSRYIEYVAKEIAGIKGISTDEVYEATWNNAMKLYRM